MTTRPPRAYLAILVVVGVARGLSADAAVPVGVEQPPARDAERPPAPPVADAEQPPAPPAADGSRTRFFPLPLYATSPSEGSTYGVLPVIMRIDASGRTTSIIAPSVSWNSAAGLSGTFRFYKIADTARLWWIIANASTGGNRSLRLEYRDMPGGVLRPSFEVQGLARRNIFYRYFGLGPNTDHADQSSYIRVMALLSMRTGINVARHFNVGVRGGVRYDRPEFGAVFDLPPTQLRYPTAPGLDGAALGTAELSLRFDTRNQGDYDVRGVASELHLARDFGITRSPSFWRVTWHTRVLWEETSFLSGAAHLYYPDESGGNDVPFYYRSALGGDTLFRGYTDDRFIDRGAWEAEFEQRFRLFQTQWFGVKADWRIDPFVAIGQVYPDYSQMFSHVRYVGGVGLRAFVHPNVLGRVDIAYSSDGLTAYVLMGYPY
jgi:outer membrane protein assembly factor BamA